MIPWNTTNIKKTSEQWSKEQPSINVLDPDGWDRRNFQYSWYEELITKEEFNYRLMGSTLCMNPVSFAGKGAEELLR